MISSSTDRFARYEEDFLNSSRIVTRTITQLSGTRGNVDSIISISVDVDYELAEAEAYVRAMDVEFRSMPSADKKSISAKVQKQKTRITCTYIHFGIWSNTKYAKKKK